MRDSRRQIANKLEKMVKHDFEGLVHKVNRGLPKDQRITGYDIMFNEPELADKEIDFQISITKIGGKRCAGETNAKLPLPDYLKKPMQTFVGGYPFPITIDLYNWNEDECK